MAEKRRRSDSVIPPEVDELIERSQTIRGWVDKLREHEGETSRAVYEKVLADYRERLESVTADLRTHRADLVETLERRRAEVETLRADREDHAARLEEARLRHSVGEFDDGEWDERREEIESTLSRLDDRLTEESATVEELEGIIEAIPAEGEEPTEAPAPWPAAEEGGEARGSREGVSGARVADGADGDEGAEPGEELEEAEAVGAVGEREEPSPDAEATEEGAEAAAAAEAEKGARPRAVGADSEDRSYVDELEFLESLSLEEADRFDAVSAMLEEDEGGKSASE